MHADSGTRSDGGRSFQIRGGKRIVVFVVVSTVAAMALGALLGALVLKPKAVAETRLVVGSQTLRAQEVPGYALATQQLAKTYARFASSDSVTADTRGEVSSIEATPIPDSAIIRLQATAATTEAAVAGATKAAEALIDAAGRADLEQGMRGAAERYSAARLAVAEKESQLARAKRDAQNDPGDREAKDAFDRAQVALDLARLDVESLSQAYREAVTTDANGSSGLTVVQKAAITTSGSARSVQMGAVAGGVLCLLGWGLAAWLSQRRATRSDAAVPATPTT